MLKWFLALSCISLWTPAGSLAQPLTGAYDVSLKTAEGEYTTFLELLGEDGKNVLWLRFVWTFDATSLTAHYQELSRSEGENEYSWCEVSVKIPYEWTDSTITLPFAVESQGQTTSVHFTKTREGDKIRTKTKTRSLSCFASLSASEFTVIPNTESAPKAIAGVELSQKKYKERFVLKPLKEDELELEPDGLLDRLLPDP